MLPDVDECSETTTLCSAIENQICRNVPGSFNCTCPDGTEVVDDRCVGTERVCRLLYAMLLLCYDYMYSG